MIFFYLAKWVVALFTALTAWLPTVDTLPFGVEDYLAMGVGYFRALADFFPPLYTLLTVFVVYFGFKVTLMSLRLVRIIR